MRLRSALIFSFLAVLSLVACAAFQRAADNPKPVVDEACKTVQAIADDGRVAAVCAATEGLLELADIVSSVRADAGHVMAAAHCTTIPETTQCATNAELARAIQIFKLRHPTPKDAGTMSDTIKVKHLSERVVTGHRLGRHVEHDPRSLSFLVTAAAMLHSVAWPRHCDPFDQGDLGSCTGNALAGACMTGPLFVPGRTLTEADAVSIYSEATKVDNVPGHYPPDDTGSSGLAVCKVAKKRGLIGGYRHAVTLNGALSALTRGPILLGANWYEGFDKPVGVDAELVIAGDVRGGHEFEILAIDVERKLVRMCQSWGLEWGDHGYAVLSFATLERLLHEEGDVRAPFAAS